MDTINIMAGKEQSIHELALEGDSKVEKYK